MPIIIPPQEIIERKNSHDDKVEAYANLVRDIYSETYKIEKVDNSLQQKVKLNEYLYQSKLDIKDFKFE